MRKNLVLTLLLGAALAIAIAAIPTATTYARFCPFSSTPSEEAGCPAFPNLKFKFDAGITPKKLSKHKLAPAALNLSGQISTTDATHPSALRELTIDLDRNIAIDAKGLPACHPFRRYVRAGESCRSAIIGKGTASFEIALPEEAPVLAPGHLAVYNGGVKAGVTTFFAIAFLTVPVPSEIVTPVKIKKIHQGRYGLRAVAKIPVIAGGDGSLLDFNLELKRLFTYKHTRKSYAMAKCPDGHLDAEIVSALFRNETKTPGVASQTTLRGTVIRPCTPKG